MVRNYNRVISHRGISLSTIARTNTPGYCCPLNMGSRLNNWTLAKEKTCARLIAETFKCAIRSIRSDGESRGELISRRGALWKALRKSVRDILRLGYTSNNLGDYSLYRADIRFCERDTSKVLPDRARFCWQPARYNRPGRAEVVESRDKITRSKGLRLPTHRQDTRIVPRYYSRRMRSGILNR